ncbi:hypothetical protein JW933_01730 [candidate division FCPU426 bacterium]|nr:hypothetical protein [candidate division FCPU426 bacterium]
MKVIARDIRYLKTALPLRPPAEPLSPVLWLMGFFFPPLVVLVLWGWRRHLDRLAADPRYARKLTASKSARQALKQARQARLRRDPKKFYGALTQAVTGYLADELGVSRSGITQREIVHRLHMLGAEKALLEQLTELFDETDYARFAAGGRELAEMGAHEKRAEVLLTQLGKILRKERRV